MGWTGGSGEDQRRSAPPPVQARPVALRVPTEDAIIGRELKQNGSAGSMRIERTGRSDLRARLTFAGRRSAQSVETCSIAIGGSEGALMTQQGRPDGLQRYQIEDPASTCPLQVDILDEAVLVTPKGESCLIQTSTCQADASGMWGPEPAQLIAKARDYETARGVADKAVRDNYKLMTQRARREDVRPIVSEQAAFSADREQFCRSYAREGTHGFCHLRFTENRALALATRLGANTAVPTAAAAPRRSRPKPATEPAVDGMNPDTAGGMPPE